MSVYSAASASTSRLGSAPRRPKPRTLDPETAHERHERQYRLQQSYGGGQKKPARPTKTELDVLKERHQFVRTSQTDPATLSWEDQLALKYYDSLFREYALVNLKHYKSGQVALRWRTEPEVLSGIGHLTCGSLRCENHEPDPSLLASLEALDVPLDPEDETPLVRVALEETEMQFGYVEDGERKSVLVKVVLCRDCAKKVRYGREKAKREREERALAARGGADEAKSRAERDEEEEERRRRRRSEPEPKRQRREEADEYGPSLPPDLDDHDRRRRHASPMVSQSLS
ncbi:hypothetical protein JCM10213v2_002869 [Rhodosporidiobolus nylandii]